MGMHKYARLDDDEHEEIVLGNGTSRERISQDSDEDVGRHYKDDGYANHTASVAGNITNSVTPSTAVTLRDRLNDSRLMQMAICSLATILLYLFLSICLTFYQKGKS